MMAMIRRLLEWWRSEMRGLDDFRAQTAARLLRREKWRAKINRGKR